MDKTHHYPTVSNEDDLQTEGDDEDDSPSDDPLWCSDDEEQSDDLWSDDDLTWCSDDADKQEEDGDDDDDDDADDLQTSGDDADKQEDDDDDDDDDDDEDDLQLQTSSDDADKRDDLQMGDDDEVVAKKPLVHRRGFWSVQSTFLSDRLSVHAVTCKEQGTCIVRRELLERSNLSSHYSECTLRRRCKRAIGGHQYATANLLRVLKGEELVSADAKKVSVVTIKQARDILTSFGHSKFTPQMLKKRSCTTDNTAEMESLRKYLTDAVCPRRKSLKAPIRGATVGKCLSLCNCKLID